MANRANIWLVIHLSASFLLLFTAFGSCQNVVSEAYTLNNYGNLGFYTLWAIYLSAAVCSLFATPIISKFGSRKSIQVGSFWYFVWVVSGILPIILESSSTTRIIVYIAMMLSGMIIGFGGSLIWVGQGKYMTDWCAPENKGFYFGLFWWIYMNSQVIGNLISAFILDIFSQIVFFSIMSGFALLGSISFLFLLIPQKQNKNESLIKSQELSRDFKVNEPLISEATENSNNSYISKDRNESNMSTMSAIKLFATLQMMKINAHIAVGSVILSIFSGFLVKMISNTVTNEADKLPKSLYCMIVFGLGEISGAYAIGKFIDFTSNRAGVVCSLLFVILTYSTLIYTHSRNSYDIFWFITAYMIGILDSIVSTVNGSICSTEFISDDRNQGSIEPFAIYIDNHNFYSLIDFKS